ncbi:MAG: hypothetical protein ACFFB3_12435 [Candidatus Hodarchaeota archaeon]
MQSKQTSYSRSFVKEVDWDLRTPTKENPYFLAFSGATVIIVSKKEAGARQSPAIVLDRDV